jgi:hypothetical protein
LFASPDIEDRSAILIDAESGPAIGLLGGESKELIGYRLKLFKDEHSMRLQILISIGYRDEYKGICSAFSRI